MAELFKPIDGARKKPPTTKKEDDGWRPLLEIAEIAPPAPAEHFRKGLPSARWVYRDQSGRPIGEVWRFNFPEGKEIVPLTYCRHEQSGEFAWRFKSWSVPRPVYGLDRLAKAPTATVVVVEGERCADAVQQLLPAMVGITSPGGSKSAAKAAWGVLKDREVIVWPDADEPGKRYGADVSRELRKVGARSVRLLAAPTGVSEGWDVADALSEGWTQERALEFVSTPPEATLEKPDKKVGARSSLIDVSDGIEKWRDENGEPHVTFHNGRRRVHCLVRDRQFRNHLTFEAEQAAGTIPPSQAVEDVLRSIEGHCSRGPVYDTFRRVAASEHAIFLDLADDLGKAVKVTADGWTIVSDHPIKFIRNGSMKAIPEPEGGSMIEELRSFVHGDDDVFVLVVAWLIGCLMHKGPFPVLIIGGEQGSGKSFISRLLRALIDPSTVPLRSMPREERDLLVAALNNWVIGFDNLSTMPNWLSDALCRISTGSGFGTRKLHTDGEEMIIGASRPVMTNSIIDLAERPDFADRSIGIHLPRISESERRAEADVWKAFEEARPRILGALLDAAATGLRRRAAIRLDRLPRLADFAIWVEACAPALGLNAGEFLDAYDRNKVQINEVALEADPVAIAILNFVKGLPSGQFEGSPSQLLADLNSTTPEASRKSKYWPMTPNAMGSRIKRVAPLLRGAGFEVDSRKSGTRTIRIVNLAAN